MIACAFTEYTTICKRGAGGVKRTAGISRSKIASITFTTGEVTAISIVASSHFAQVLWADNNTATFTESEPTRDSDIKTQEMIAKFCTVLHKLQRHGLNRWKLVVRVLSLYMR